MDKKFTKFIKNRFQKDHNVLGVMLFGSVVRGKADQYSDIDVYVVLKNRQRYSRENLIFEGKRLDIFFDILKEAKSYLRAERSKLKRVTSHMLAYGKIIFQHKNYLSELQKAARENLRTKTLYTKEEILMHAYSIDDFWGEVQRDFSKNDNIAFGLDSNLLINNIIELVLKIHRTFLRQPNEMATILAKIDKRVAVAIDDFYNQASLKRRKKALEKLVSYVFSHYPVELPNMWRIK